MTKQSGERRFRAIPRSLIASCCIASITPTTKLFADTLRYHRTDGVRYWTGDSAFEDDTILCRMVMTSNRSRSVQRSFEKATMPVAWQHAEFPGGNDVSQNALQSAVMNDYKQKYRSSASSSAMRITNFLVARLTNKELGENLIWNVSYRVGVRVESVFIVDGQVIPFTYGRLIPGTFRQKTYWLSDGAQIRRFGKLKLLGDRQTAVDIPVCGKSS